MLNININKSSRRVVIFDVTMHYAWILTMILADLNEDATVDDMLYVPQDVLC